MSPVYASTVPAAVERLQTAVDEWNTGDNIDRADPMIIGDISLVLAELARTQEQLAAYRLIESGSPSDIARRAIAAWGVDAQMGMVNEECAELIAALNRWKRGRIPAEEVAEEVADVLIMLEQTEQMIGVDTTPFVAAKLERLKALIATHEQRAKGGE